MNAKKKLISVMVSMYMGKIEITYRFWSAVNQDCGRLLPIRIRSASRNIDRSKLSGLCTCTNYWAVGLFATYSPADKQEDQACLR